MGAVLMETRDGTRESGHGPNAHAAAQLDPAHRLHWRLHSRSRHFRERVDKAKRIIRDALDLGPAYVSVSGGKDSVALLALARDVRPDIPAWYLDGGNATPDTHAVLTALERDHGLRREPWHVGEDVSAPAARLRERDGYLVAMIGLRADESRARTLRMRRCGHTHRMVGGWWHCCPMAWMSGLDSLAVCEMYGYPISLLYRRRGHIPPDERRTDAATAAEGIERGALVALRRSDPLFWRQLVTMYPEYEAMS